MKIWITGGGGSLGSVLHFNLLTKFPDADIYSPTSTELNLLHKSEVQDFVTTLKPTHVFHLAAKVYGIEGHKNFPEKCLLKNTEIDNNVFGALFKHPPQWIYYASSVAAYGFPYVELPLKEKHWNLGIPHESEFGYAMGKRNSYSYLELLARTRNVKFVYGLTTNLFGSGDKFLKGNGHVVISLLEKAKLAKQRNSQLKVWGSGSASRDFLSVQSASQILIDLIEVDARVLNIASGQEIKVTQIASLITEIFALDKGFDFTGENEGVLNRFCDVSRLKQFSQSAHELNSIEELRKLITFSAISEST